LNSKKIGYRDYLLIALSIAAAIWFFMGYPSQDPRSSVNLRFTKQQIRSKAVKKLASLGYSPNNFIVLKVQLKKHEALLNHLQQKLGRNDFNKWMLHKKKSNIKPFYWQISFKPKKQAPTFFEFINKAKNTETTKILQVYFDQQGKFIALGNSYDRYPRQKVRRKALNSVVKSEKNTAGHSLFSDVPDTTLKQLLIFGLQKKHGDFSDYHRESETEVRSHFKRGFPYILSTNDARSLANFYLSQTGWNPNTVQFDSIFVQRISKMNIANVQYLSSDSKTGQKLQINVAVAPTGALVHLNTSNIKAEGQSSSAFLWHIARLVVLVVLGLTGIIIFFFRIRAGTIDTRPAFIFAICMSLVFLIRYLLDAANMNLLNGSTNVPESIFLYYIVIGIVISAIAGVCLFMLFSIGESITRQHWPQKLLTLDYLRQGNFAIKPLGRTLLNGVIFAFILAGFWTLILYIFQHVSLSSANVFFRDNAFLSPLVLFFTNSLYSLGIAIPAFLVIGSWAYRKTQTYWAAGLIIALTCSVMVPVIVSLGPPWYEYLIGFLLGGGLAFIYIQQDFLTLILGYFLFLCLIASVTGWMIPHSPDELIFIIVLIVLGIFVIIGGFAFIWGEGEQSLQVYEPEYVEELAQEQRIKQELHIARDVQQSFLPAQIPTLQNLDIAAVCLPANETGGDYYDLIRLDEHRVAVAIGDVSGKGIEAAFYMTLVKGMLHTLCRESTSPVEILSKINQLFYDNSAKRTFISLIFGVIDTREKTFTLVRAGHNPILHVQSSTGNIDILKPDGMGLGLTKDEIFDNKIGEIKLSITEDDLFLLYTDGIVEALNQAHQFYGTQNLIELIKEQKDNSASKVVTAVTRSVNRFIGAAKRHDDMTLIAIRLLSKEV
jgi:serine phosphatase RsbU (regulator of sigma subunit)